MTQPICKGDKLENGGEVTSASSTLQFMEKPLARKGDDAICAIHGKTVIDQGCDRFLDIDGTPIALHHHRCRCGCRLIASLSVAEIR